MNRITCSRCLGKKHVDQADIKRLNRENEWIPGPCAYCEEKGVVNSDKMDKALVDDADIVYNIDSKELYLGSNPKANKIENKKTEKIDVNEEIEGSLKECIKESIKDFINTQNPHPLFVKIFSALQLGMYFCISKMPMYFSILKRSNYTP